MILLSPNCADLAKHFPAAQHIEIKHFPDSENYVRVPECSGSAFLVHRCYPQQDVSLMQLFLALGAMRDAGAEKAIAVVPYLPYARQDKRVRSVEAISAQAVCRLMKAAGADALVTFDCHFLKKPGVFEYAGLGINNLTMRDSLASHLKGRVKNPMLISPDEGARYFVEGENGMAMKKVRGRYRERGSIYRAVSGLKMPFDVAGKDVLILDDIISTGGTMVKAIKACVNGGAASVRCGATHGLFIGDTAAALKRAGAAEIICSNTILGEFSKLGIADELNGVLK
jgi:ribose-phosphate pyrophosphokinase